MQARRAARELALILFSQLDKDIESYKLEDLNDIILKSVRILTNNATEDLQLTLGAILDIKQFIEEYESNDEINLSRPLDSSNIPIPIPMTSDMVGRLDELTEIAEKALLALEIAEFTTLDSQVEVKDFAIEVCKTFQKEHAFVDEQIQNSCKGWDISRLVKIDKDVLRIAIVELLFIKKAPVKVIVDEALELVKKYSTDESSSFVNGVLSKVILENGLN